MPALPAPLPVSALPAVGMCNNTGAQGDSWGGKCTIDAKRLWKIFYITPGEQGGPGGNLKVGRVPGGRAVRGWAGHSTPPPHLVHPPAPGSGQAPTPCASRTALLAHPPTRPRCSSSAPAVFPPAQVKFKNLRLMNGNSKNGFGGAIEVSGPVDLTFINCEFGGSQSECWLAWCGCACG